ncbi:hypothetical protein ONT16_10490 [Prevotella copri]|uniref:PPM-type phosphatase domain-containing protein n=1 Tax=Segatella copri TaxID=165179 RepID=A0AAP3BET9_9BACT|nr:hypothetical protein [Segatella copri]MCW4128672.1 hypothetical protein [Segatella copri]MCW4414934.1 hypothetical protein [Segatella copri]MCW4421936.1 hypothetical protein [Segatella copri]
MKIIESNIIGKKSQETCEDGLVMTDDFIAVIDGSTSKTPKHLSPDMKNGRYAMMLISEYIQQEMKADATVDEFCEGITAYIYNKVYQPMGIEEQLRLHPEERLTASAVIYSNQKKEVWMVGDCQAIINGKLYDNSKPYEQEIATRRVTLIQQGMTPAEARKSIEPLLIEAMLGGQNKCYAVIDGFPIYREGVRVVSLEEESSTISSFSECNTSSQEIVLASDGYPFLKPTLAASEAALEHLIANDPQCIHDYIATKGLVAGNKSFDDRTYIRFII